MLGMIGLSSAIGSVLFPAGFFDSMFFKIILLLLLVNMSLCTANQLLRYLKKDTNQTGAGNISLRQIALLTLHTGIVLILIGGTVNTFLGVREQIALLEGEAADISMSEESVFSFNIKLEDFEIEYNPDGSASQFYSHLSILEGNCKVGEETISINHPLKYKGVKVYLMKYIYLIDVYGQSKPDWQKNELLGEGEFFRFPETAKSLEIKKYVPNYHPKYGANSLTLRPDNPRILYYVHEEGKNPKLMEVSLGRQIELEPGVSFKFNGVKPYVAFIVKYDPGLLIAALGGLMLMGGVCLSFKREKR